MKSSKENTARPPSTELGRWELHQVARELQMSIDDVLLVKNVFDSFDEDRSGSLDITELGQAVTRLLQVQHRDPTLSTERVKAMCEWYWWDGGKSKDDAGTISFMEFLKWYSSNGFSEDLLLTASERWLRGLAKKYGQTPEYVEVIKRCFDLYDEDGSGTVEFQEFRLILHKVLRVPSHLELPPSRIQYFWTEIDTDGSGSVEFEEFISWWLRYFDERDQHRSAVAMPFEVFYKQIRRMGPQHHDPPAYLGRAGVVVDA